MPPTPPKPPVPRALLNLHMREKLETIPEEPAKFEMYMPRGLVVLKDARLAAAARERAAAAHAKMYAAQTAVVSKDDDDYVRAPPTYKFDSAIYAKKVFSNITESQTSQNK